MRLEEEGLKPVPVIHDIGGHEIDHYIEREYPIVAIGSSQITDLDSLMNVVDRFDGTGIKLHLFGNSSFDLLAKAPLFSCDTTNWAIKGSFGDVLYWNPQKRGFNKTDKIYLQEFFNPARDENRKSYSSYEFKEDFDKYLSDTFGLCFSDLIGVDGTYNKMLVNTHFYAQLEDIVNEIHRKKGVVTE